MQKKQLGTIFILVMTIGLLGAVAYFSIMLNNQGEKAVTTIKKTKASAQTYHKLLALNVTPVPTYGAGDSSSSSSTGGSSSSSVTAVPSPTAALISKNTVTPTSGASSSSPAPTPTAAPLPTTAPTRTPTAALPTSFPTPTAPLLAYRTLTPTPTLIPVKETGGSAPVPTATKTPTKTPTKAPQVTPQKTDTLPETGWVQYSSILFIVAAATVFVSFLF